MRRNGGNHDSVEHVVAYTNTIGQQYTASEMKDAIGKMGSDTLMDSNMLALIYYEYYEKGEIGNISLDDFIEYMENDIMSNEMFSSQFDENSKAQIKKYSLFSSIEELTKSRSSAELGQIFGLDFTMIDSMLIRSGTSSMSIEQFLQLITTNPTFTASMASANEESLQQMQQLQMIVTGVMQEKLYSATELLDW